MNKIEFLQFLNRNLNKNSEYNVHLDSESISFRLEPIRGTFRIEIAELVKGIPSFLLEVVDLDGHFEHTYKMILVEMLRLIEESLGSPYTVVGGNGARTAVLEDILLGSKLTRMNISEQILFNDEDSDINWIYYSNDTIFNPLLEHLNQFFQEYKAFVIGRREIGRKQINKTLFKCFQKEIITCGERISFSIDSINPIKFKLDSKAIEYDIVTENVKLPIAVLFGEFHDLMSLKWLVEDKVLTSASDLASIHCRGNIKMDAFQLQQSALAGDWSFDDIDTIFRLLCTDNFNNVLDTINDTGIKEFEILNYLVDFTDFHETGKIIIKWNDFLYFISIPNGFPIDPVAAQFGKSLL